MILMQDLKLFWATLLKMLNQEELLTPSRAERPCREILTNERWTITNSIKFNKSKCQDSAPGKAQPWLYIQTGGCDAGKQTHLKRSGGLDWQQAQHESTMLPGSQEGQRILGCIKHGIVNMAREVIVPLHTALLQPQCEYCMQFWTLQYKKQKNY